MVFVLCLAGIGCAVAQIRCVDAAREAARLAGRGDNEGAVAAARAIAPSGATVTVGIAGELVSATVIAEPIGGLLPGITLRATAHAANEENTNDSG